MEDEKKITGQIFKNAFKELGETLVAFVKAPRALWGINVPYVFEGLAYFGILTILGKYCSENIGLSDPQAGWVYGGVTGGITFAMLLLGGVVDRIGVRASLLFALLAFAVGRIVITVTGILPLGSGIGSLKFMTMAFGLLIMVTAYGLYQPAAYAGVKRYTNPKTAAMGYAVLYSLMNLGAFIAGSITDFSRKVGEPVFPPNGLLAVFFAFTVISILAVIITFFILTRRVDRQAVERVKREKADMQDLNTESVNNEKDQSRAVPTKSRQFVPYGVFALVCFVMAILFAAFQVKVIWSIMALVLTALFLSVTSIIFLRTHPHHPFRDGRFMYFIFILIPVQTLFAHNWLTIPYYLDRAFRDNWIGEYFALFSNINPLIIFIITPIIAGLTARANVYRMMILGTFIMAAPTFLLAVGPIPWLFLIYILIMSVGEAMWQPRFLQWVAEIAPEGQTGAYMGIGQFPWFLTKVITSLYSGYFVANYIPKPDSGLPQRTGEMWLVYAAIAMISTIGLVLAKKWMTKGMRGNS